ncbi:hypothetical protein [Wolbachia endosymbiont (group B) of Philonthus cognatus]|uniref:hypothetical protein n=1 Tax=Wolbachia endosymbiont (group B) of Philonthus cognatus TaxID=2954047 RepID=UPI00221EF1A1|nr:hypothetical protein [Wolbachia endosymbiont (group B) of Philonthus cognatus]
MKIMDQPPNPKEARQFSTLPICTIRTFYMVILLHAKTSHISPFYPYLYTKWLA